MIQTHDENMKINNHNTDKVHFKR